MIQAVELTRFHVILKESDRYPLSLLRMFCRSVCAYPEDADEIDIMTHDGKYYSADPASIKCPLPCLGTFKIF